MNDLSNLIITIDTREKSRERIQVISSFFEKHGAAVDYSKLDLCDYHIEGNFRNKDINLGIEAKSLVDFTSSHKDLSDKLKRSYDLYKDVGLFVESGSYSFTVEHDGLHCVISNPAVKDGKADILKLAVFENLLGSLAYEGIIVRQLINIEQWPYSIFNALIHITKESHSGLKIKSNDYRSQLINILTEPEGLGLEFANKMLSNYWNLTQLIQYRNIHNQIDLGISKNQAGIWEEFCDNEILKSSAQKIK